MQEKTSALVLRELRVGECDKLLTVLTPDLGKITVKARGALRKGSRISSASQLFAFSDMTLFQASARWTLDEAEPIELFCPLRERVESLALAAYVAEVLDALSDADAGCADLLRLGLNTLFAISEQTAPEDRIRAAFELRAAVLGGYAPDPGDDQSPVCVVCGKADPLFLCPDAGGVYCREHLPPGQGAHPLRAGAGEALCYVTGCDLKRLFAFRLSPEGQKSLSAAAEQYLSVSLARNFRTLGYYKQFL